MNTSHRAATIAERQKVGHDLFLVRAARRDCGAVPCRFGLRGLRVSRYGKDAVSLNFGTGLGSGYLEVTGYALFDTTRAERANHDLPSRMRWLRERDGL